MASDSTGKASPGSPFRLPPASLWNNMVDAGRAFADGQLSSGAPGATRTRATDLLKLKNSSAAVRRKGEILKISGRAITNITDEHIWLNGVEPTSDCRFGILKEPAETGTDEVYTAQISGICIALVNVTDATHTFAAAADGEYVLQSGDSGPLEILDAPEGTGELECVVRFAAVGGGVDIIRFVIEETNCDYCSALVRVASWPKGRKPTGSSNDYDYDNDLLRVWDLADCFFNAPSLDLVGRIGYAVKLYHEDIASPPRCDIQFSERWEVIFLCCQ